MSREIAMFFNPMIAVLHKNNRQRIITQFIFFSHFKSLSLHIFFVIKKITFLNILSYLEDEQEENKKWENPMFICREFISIHLCARGRNSNYAESKMSPALSTTNAVISVSIRFTHHIRKYTSFNSCSNAPFERLTYVHWYFT